MKLPADFVERTRRLLGDSYEGFEQALSGESPVSLRINTGKISGCHEYKSVPWSENGYYLPERLNFTFDPYFHAGAYYVQEASSMFLEQIIKTYVNGDVKCLDLCAAPGGKSTHLRALLTNNSLLVSNEVIRNRAQILAENVAKWGGANHVVSRNDPENFGRLPHFFDVIVADVPCSGEGMFRKDPVSLEEWSVGNVQKCAARQKRILMDVWDALASGGVLIYSTCTYNTEENEDMIRFLIDETGCEVLEVPVMPDWRITGALKYDFPVYRFLPHKTTGEGFFTAVVRKPEEERIKRRTKKKPVKGKAPETTVPAEVKQWLKEKEQFEFYVAGETIYAYNHLLKDDLKQLCENLDLITPAIRIGEIKGKDIIPAHELSLHTFFHAELFSQISLNWDEAIRYLRREPLHIIPDVSRGFKLVTYEGLPLGFIKHLGNRSNNLYPNEWRIRSGYLPHEPKTFSCK